MRAPEPDPEPDPDTARVFGSSRAGNLKQGRIREGL